jgi:CheY-like chemotaxis protein
MSEKILIIDDDLDTLRLVGLMLQRQGYQISAATNGQQGLDKAFEEDPDLILLDVMMPEMDGYETTRAIRQMNQFRNLPIIALTAKAMKGDRESAIARPTTSRSRSIPTACSRSSITGSDAAAFHVEARRGW